VVGLPLNMDGSEGAQAAAARAFGEALRGTGLAVVYEDERLTSWQARDEMRSRGRMPDRRSGEVDSAAARLILQQYLDALPAEPAEATRPAEETE
jgi:putative Holliday junction resolvase